MVKTFGLVALAAVAALILGFGSHLGSSTPKASADTTDVVVIGCELIAGAVDGDTTNALTNNDVAAACGGTATALDENGLTNPLAGERLTLPAIAVKNTLTPFGFQACGQPATVTVGTGTCASIAALAKAIGDEDGKLEASDFRGELDENWDDNQMSTDCSFANVGTSGFGNSVLGLGVGFACTLDVFVFVNDNAPVTFDAPSGLTWIENHTQDLTCNTDSEASGTTGPGARVSINPAGPFTNAGNIKDNDCSDAIVAAAPCPRRGRLDFWPGLAASCPWP